MTGKEVYDLALVLIDEVTDEGYVIPDNPKYYETKSIALLTMLQAEVLPLSQTPVVIKSLDDNLLVDDRVCISVLPYGLAAQLLMQERPNAASYLNDLFNESKSQIINNSIVFEPIFTIEG